MKYIYYMAFVSAVIVLGWILRPLEEHMTNGTCKRPVYGPKGVDAEKCARVYPEVYGPNGSGNRLVSQGDEADTETTQSNSDRNNIVSTTSMYEDDGEFRSDTATRNAAYMNVFTFKPYAKTDFPSSGPPQPYLSDFANFHR